jgi:hypothetical protein
MSTTLVEEVKPRDLCTAGLAALTRELGSEGTITFLEQFVEQARGCPPGQDFAKWLNEQPELTMDEAIAATNKAYSELIASGRFADKII